MPTMKLRAVTSLCLLASFLAISAAQEYTCSASQQCEIGCCSSSGYCGFGPDFCGETCLSTCDRKSECDPGWGTEVIITLSLNDVHWLTRPQSHSGLPRTNARSMSAAQSSAFAERPRSSAETLRSRRHHVPAAPALPRERSGTTRRGM